MTALVTSTNFYLDDGDIAWQSDGTNTLHFAYDGSGSLTYLNYNGQNYYYERNAQNDVVGLVDSNMNEVVTYSYDTWGQLLSIGGSLTGTLGKLNPFRYRGYYYDSETGLCYLKSRYYDPNTGRFLNADGQFSDGLLETNLFAYCNNNPVNMSDTNGDFAWLLALIPAFSNPVTAIIAVVVIVVVVVIAYVAINHALYEYNNSHIQYADDSEGNSTPSPSKTKHANTGGNSDRDIFGNPASETPTASGLREHAESQGWTKTQKETGPEKWVDVNNIPRVTLKKGSPRTEGSERPHVKIKDQNGDRIDRFGNPVTRKSPGNHTPIKWDGD